MHKSPNRKPTQIRHVDLFAGAGGIATGFHAAGLTTLLAVEYVDSCVETYSANHPGTPILKRDVREVKLADLKRAGVMNAEVVSAGMPCETFSTAGSKSRSFYDHRQVLYRDAIRIAQHVQAEMIVFENVPGLLTKRVSSTSSALIVDQIESELRDEGFLFVTRKILNAADYGVPQNRDRLFIIATRNFHDFRTPKASRRRNTVEDAFVDLPSVAPNGLGTSEFRTYMASASPYSRLMRSSEFWGTSLTRPKVPTHHDSPRHRERTLERFELIEPGEGLKDLFEKLSAVERERLQAKGVLPNKWYIQRNRRLVADSTSPTVTSHCLDELIHPYENRALTIREAARLQSFPDWYQIVGGPDLCPHKDFQQDKYEQIGDAVPPLLARAVGLEIVQCFGRSNLAFSRRSVA